MISTWIQIAGRSRGINFTLCSLRLLRLLHPLTQYGAFSVLDAILHTLNRGWTPVSTMLALITAPVLIQGVVGVYAYAGSFRRRCVWADSMEVKIPEQWCSRYEENSLGGRARPGQLRAAAGLPRHWQPRPRVHVLRPRRRSRAPPPRATAHASD